MSLELATLLACEYDRQQRKWLRAGWLPDAVELFKPELDRRGINPIRQGEAEKRISIADIVGEHPFALYGIWFATDSPYLEFRIYVNDQLKFRASPMFLRQYGATRPTSYGFYLLNFDPATRLFTVAFTPSRPITDVGTVTVGLLLPGQYFDLVSKTVQQVPDLEANIVHVGMFIKKITNIRHFLKAVISKIVQTVRDTVREKEHIGERIVPTVP